MSTNSVTVSKGFYNDGTYKIMLPDSNISLSDLVLGQTYGCLNDLYVTSFNGIATIRASSVTPPAGVYDIYRNLEHPIYLSYEKNYIAGDAIKHPEVSYVTNARTTFVRPDLTSTTSYGVVSDIAGDTNCYKALDGLTNTQASLRNTNYTSYWWKWVLPHKLVFNSSSKLTFVQRDTSEGCSGWRFYADTARAQPLGSSFSTSGWSSRSAHDIVCSNLTGEVITDTVYLYCASTSSWPGMSELRFSGVDKILPPLVEIGKGLEYTSTNDATYWMPSSTSLTLEEIKQAANTSDRNYIYYTNTDGQDVSDVVVTSDSTVEDVDTIFKDDKSVFFSHAHDKILGVGKYPDQIALEAISTVITTNYTVTGSPSIASNFIASGFSSSNYLTSSSVFNPSSSPYEIYLKVTTGASVTGVQPFFDTSFTEATGLYIGLYSGKFWASGGNGSWIVDGGSYTASANTTYWVKFVFTGTQYAYMVSTDGVNYTDSVRTNSSTALSYTNAPRLGWCSRASGAFAGSIDLKECYIKVNGTEVWRAVESDQLDTIAADSVHYWTNQMNTTIDVQGVTAVAASSWEGSTGTTGYVLCENGSLSLTKLNTFTDTGDKAYTGYTATFTDSTGAVVSSLTKTGTLCRCFKRGLGWVFIPEADMPDYYEEEDTHVYTEGEANEVPLLESSTVPIKGQPSTQQYTYSRSAGGVTDESDNFYADIGYIYVEWVSA